MKSRGALWVGLALLLALASAISATVGRGEDSSRILVAMQPLTSGQDVEAALADGQVAFQDVPGMGELSGLIEDAALLVGTRLSVPLQEGEPVTAATLGGLQNRLPQVGPSERLLSIPLSSAGAVATAVGPGAEVDVVASATEGPIAAAKIIAERSEVVSVEDRAEALERGAGGVLIRVTDDEALVVTEALATGADLRLIVRPVSFGARP